MRIVVNSIAAAACAIAAMGGMTLRAAAAEPPVKWVRSIPLDLALEAAEAAMAECRSHGRHGSIGVVDFDGNLKVLLIDDNTPEVGQHALIHKMYTGVLMQTTTETMVERSPPGVRSEIDPEADILDKIAPGGLISPGAVALKAGGDFVGVLGVGGTGLGMGPGAEAQCAQVGADKIKDRLK